MTRLRTHNLRAKRRERKDRLGFMLPSRWRMYGHQRRALRYFGVDMGRGPAAIVEVRIRIIPEPRNEPLNPHSAAHSKAFTIWKASR